MIVNPVRSLLGQKMMPSICNISSGIPKPNEMERGVYVQKSWCAAWKRNSAKIAMLTRRVYRSALNAHMCLFLVSVSTESMIWLPVLCSPRNCRLHDNRKWHSKSNERNNILFSNAIQCEQQGMNPKHFDADQCTVDYGYELQSKGTGKKECTIRDATSKCRLLRGYGRSDEQVMSGEKKAVMILQVR